MEEQNSDSITKEPIFKKWWFWLIMILLLAGILLAAAFALKHKKSTDLIDQNVTGEFQKCPSNLSGVLTYPLMDPKYIGSMIPLGNVAPPGHTDPVDHIYFNLNTDEKVPLYAPADGWITHIMANSVKKTAGSDYEFESFVVTYTICDGLILDFAGYNDVIQPIKDELAKRKDSCKGGIKKSGHDNAGEQQCDYQDLKIKVTAGQQIGYTQRAKRPEGGYTIPFEIWTADYNKEPRKDVNWDKYYDDNRYAHWLCTFDLYSGDLKKQFDAKFGDYNIQTIKNADGSTMTGEPVFTQRTVAPVCGVVNQDIAGTLQGAWFSHTVADQDQSGSVGESGYGITFAHYNIDPTKGIIGVGGEMHDNSTGIAIYTPTHTGRINRDPSEVKADGQTYCYQNDISVQNAGSGFSGKILVKLIDDHHIKAENQSGSCSANESFKTSFSFER